MEVAEAPQATEAGIGTFRHSRRCAVLGRLVEGGKEEKERKKAGGPRCQESTFVPAWFRSKVIRGLWVGGWFFLKK